MNFVSRLNFRSSFRRQFILVGQIAHAESRVPQPAWPDVVNESGAPPAVALNPVPFEETIRVDDLGYAALEIGAGPSLPRALRRGGRVV